MQISGKILVDGSWVVGTAGSFQAVDPATALALEPAISKATPAQVNLALRAAARDAGWFRRSPLAARAALLRECAKQIMLLGDDLIDRVVAETGLPRTRVVSERIRTCNQLELFADVVEQGSFLNARIDPALPERIPSARPDIRNMHQAIGPVAVFGASNFPLAFSVAGGDTASAFAAGCPVLVKGHPSHPGTGELVASAIDRAIKATAMPAGIFALLNDDGHAVGAMLVGAAEIKAVAFTGSFHGGTALMRQAAEREIPIPVFAEMGSLNPVVLLPNCLEVNAETVAAAFVESLTMGVGQFCTNPGLVFALAGKAFERFTTTAAAALSQCPAGVMLNAAIHRSYQQSVAQVGSEAGVGRVSGVHDHKTDNKTAAGFYAAGQLFRVSAADFIANPLFHQEIFGPAALLVCCRDRQELLTAISHLNGQLAGAIHGDSAELDESSELFDLLLERTGRVLVNGFPTGVEVGHAMHHGGPYPATSDPRFTSVGSAAVARFVRPVCLQNVPPALLPQALQDSNPLNLWRFVDGEWTRSAIAG